MRKEVPLALLRIRERDVGEWRVLGIVAQRNTKLEIGYFSISKKKDPLNMRNIKPIQYRRVFSYSCYSCKASSIFWDPTYGSNLVTEEWHRGGLRWAGADGWWPCTTQGHGALPGWVGVALRFRGGFWRGEKICALDMIFCWSPGRVWGYLGGMFFFEMLGVHLDVWMFWKDVKGVETWSFLLEVAVRGWRR